MVEELTYEERVLRAYFEALKEIEWLASEVSAAYTTVPLNLSIGRHQEVFKRINANLTEEVAEYYDALDSGAYQHQLDEVSDIFGFLFCLKTIAGDNSIEFDKFKSYWLDCPFATTNYSTSHIYSAGGSPYNYTGIVHSRNQAEAAKSILFIPIYKMHMVCNILKNRPWKASNYPVDTEVFNKKFEEALYCYLHIIINLGYSAKELVESYRTKHEKIMKRIKSGY